MFDDVNIAEIAIKEAKENQTRKILEIICDCKDLDEAKAKIGALLK